MKAYFSLVFCLFFCLTVLGKSSQKSPALKNPTINSKQVFTPYFKTLKSTNNLKLLIKKMKMPEKLEKEFLDSMKNDKNPMYQVRKVSSLVMEYKLDSARWARVDFSTKEGILIGKSKFQWNFNQPAYKNFAVIASILKKEYPKKSASHLLNFFVPEAHALMTEEEKAAAAIGTGGALKNYADMVFFMNSAYNWCYPDKPIRSGTSLGNLLKSHDWNKLDEQFQDRKWAEQAFFELRNYAVNYSFAESFSSGVWKMLGYEDWKIYNKDVVHTFYDVQDCFHKQKNIISERDRREHPNAEDPHKSHLKSAN